MNIGNTDPKGKKKKNLRKTKETTKKIAVKRGKVGGAILKCESMGCAAHENLSCW